MSGIKARIWVKHEKGADLLCTTDPKIINQLFGGTDLLKKGAVFSDGEEEYEIVDVRTHSYSETHDNSGEYGYNMYNVGERYPYNYDITYIVKQA